MNTFQALVVDQQNNQTYCRLEHVPVDRLSAGNVTVKVAYSSLNYKDMLAFQTKGGVIRKYPMIPGIDLSGTIISSEDERFNQGDEVLITGFGLGVTHTGGFAEIARVPADWLVKLPQGLSLKQAMIFGTAGFTAALSIEALIKNGMSTDSQVLVTGATGGVGSIAVRILAKLGYSNIIALVRKPGQVEIAKKLGAKKVIDVKDVAEYGLMDKQDFDYILDTVGGTVTAALIPKLSYGGTITVCGNAAGIKLDTNILPFILRGIKLLGIDSVKVSLDHREVLWKKLADEWNVDENLIYDEISLEELPTVVDQLKQGQHIGRTILKL